MSSPTKAKSLHDPSRVITERERHAMWAAHMQHELQKNPANEGMTIIMIRKNRSHRFVIPSLPNPNTSTTINTSTP